MKSNLRLSVILVLLILISSCTDKKTTQPEDSAPTLPPQTSMVMGFDQFPDTSSGVGLQKIKGTYSNWGWARLNVAVWNSVLTLTLAVPVAAFFESFNHQPVLQPDGSWLWAYDVTVSGSVYHAKLLGLIITEGVQWRMLLSKEGAYSDFEWFTGLSNLQATEGTWTLNKDPENKTAFLSIVWHRNLQDSTADIKYTDVQTNGYIFYGKTTEFPYNAFYQIFYAETNNETDIKWNIENKNGRVYDELHFGDTDWHCWDENLMDVDCL
jgi:hypothetical protein